MENGNLKGGKSDGNKNLSFLRFQPPLGKEKITQMGWVQGKYNIAD